MATAATSNEPSLGTLLRELSTEATDLLRQEVLLAKTEVSEKAARVGTSLGAVAAGGALAFAGALVLLYAVVSGFTVLLDALLPLEVAVWLAPLLVGGGLALFGYGRMKTALSALKAEGMAPRQTTHSLQENKEWLKAKIQ